MHDAKGKIAGKFPLFGQLALGSDPTSGQGLIEVCQHAPDHLLAKISAHIFAQHLKGLASGGLFPSTQSHLQKSLGRSLLGGCLKLDLGRGRSSPDAHHQGAQSQSRFPGKPILRSLSRLETVLR